MAGGVAGEGEVVLICVVDGGAGDFAAVDLVVEGD